MKTKNIIIICLICIILILVGILFKDKLGIEYGKKEDKKTLVLPGDEQVKVTGRAKVNYGWFSADIYNGTELTIDSFLFRIVVTENDGTLRWDRKYKQNAIVLPFMVGKKPTKKKEKQV